MNNSLRKLVILAVAAAGLLAATTGCFNGSGVSGKWKGQMTLAGGGKTLSDLEFDLTQKGGDITGLMKFTKVEGGTMKLTGKRTGDEVKFDTEHKKGLVVHFTGAVKGGSRIEGDAVLVYTDPKVPVKEDKVALLLTR